MPRNRCTPRTRTRREATGQGASTSSSPCSATLWASAISGGFPTSLIVMEEVGNSPTSPIVMEEVGSSPASLIVMEEVGSSPTSPIVMEEVGRESGETSGFSIVMEEVGRENGATSGFSITPIVTEEVGRSGQHLEVPLPRLS